MAVCNETLHSSNATALLRAIRLRWLLAHEAADWSSEHEAHSGLTASALHQSLRPEQPWLVDLGPTVLAWPGAVRPCMT